MSWFIFLEKFKREMDAKEKKMLGERGVIYVAKRAYLNIQSNSLSNNQTDYFLLRNTRDG